MPTKKPAAKKSATKKGAPKGRVISIDRAELEAEIKKVADEMRGELLQTVDIGAIEARMTARLRAEAKKRDRYAIWSGGHQSGKTFFEQFYKPARYMFVDELDKFPEPTFLGVSREHEGQMTMRLTDELVDWAAEYFAANRVLTIFLTYETGDKMEFSYWGGMSSLRDRLKKVLYYTPGLRHVKLSITPLKPAVVAAPTPEKYDDVLMPFLALMRKELHANSGKGDRPGWLQMDGKTAILEVHYHVAKLQKAMKDNDAELIREYAADVANMAMMACDVMKALEVKP